MRKQGPQYIDKRIKYFPRFLSLCEVPALRVLKLLKGTHMMPHKNDLINASWLYGHWVKYIDDPTKHDNYIKYIIKLDMFRYLGNRNGYYKKYYRNRAHVGIDYNAVIDSLIKQDDLCILDTIHDIDNRDELNFLLFHTRLSDEDRELLYNRFYREKGLRELGDEYNISHQTVKNRIEKLLQQIRRKQNDPSRLHKTC
jgi:hypothetical protein